MTPPQAVETNLPPASNASTDLADRERADRSVVPEGVESKPDLCDAPPGGLAESVGRHLDRIKPVFAATIVAVVGCVALAAVMIGLGALLIHVLLPGSLEHWDNSVERWFAARRTPTRTDLSLVGSWVAEALTVSAIGLALAVFLAIKRMWRLLGLVVFSIVIEVAVYEMVTQVISRRRPPVHWLDQLRPFASFPSGHTAAAVAIYFAIAIVVTTLTPNRAWRFAAWALAALAPVIVAVARMYRGMHHPTDVVAGYLMGVACVAVAVFAVRVGGVVADRRSANRGAIGTA
jgi:membrane-associated phospholipid phosphatase